MTRLTQLPADQRSIPMAIESAMRTSPWSLLILPGDRWVTAAGKLAYMRRNGLGFST